MENISQYGQMDFNLPHDVIQLPSNGVFYKNKKKSVKVGYLTAADENFLFSNPNDLIYQLVRNKLYESDLNPDEMLWGDIEAILIFLRNTSFGSEYTFNVTDPETGKRFETMVQLDELNIRRPSVEPNSDGTFTITLPMSGDIVKVKPLNYGERRDVEKLVDQYPVGRTAPIITARLRKMIVEVNGDSDGLIISKYVEAMPIKDSKFVRKFVEDNEPKLDLIKTVLAPSGNKVEVPITFGADFFRPFF
jgi:hypothetical protein